MNLFGVGNLNHYIKNLKLQTQWILKQQTGSYDVRGGSLEEWLDSSQRQTQESEEISGEHGDKTLRKIHQKLEAGGKLTPEERDYLQQHDPETYRELVNQEREQKAYEQALSRCKSQEEVEQLRMNKLNSSLARVRAVENNPNIPQNKKLEIAMAEKQRVDRVVGSTRKFVVSGEFAKLPVHAEEAKKEQKTVGASSLVLLDPYQEELEMINEPKKMGYTFQSDQEEEGAEGRTVQEVHFIKTGNDYAKSQSSADVIDIWA